MLFLARGRQASSGLITPPLLPAALLLAYPQGFHIPHQHLPIDPAQRRTESRAAPLFTERDDVTGLQRHDQTLLPVVAELGQLSDDGGGKRHETPRMLARR